MNKKIVRSCNFSQVGMRYKYENFFYNNPRILYSYRVIQFTKKNSKVQKRDKELKKLLKTTKSTGEEIKNKKMIYKTEDSFVRLIGHPKGKYFPKDS